MNAPYFSDDTVSLYLGDMREVLPALGVTADLIVADPPYGETSLAWDRWPDGWLDVAATVSNSLWCFGSLRMYLDVVQEFKCANWRLSQDVVWEKHNGSNRSTDRFRRIHETPTHWYRGSWAEIYHEAPRVNAGRDRRSPIYESDDRGSDHLGGYGKKAAWTDNGTRIMRSIVSVRSMHHSAIHPTEKPVGLLTPLITYACPPGGLVIDPFAGSGSTLEAARLSGRRAIGVEADEKYAELAERRLSQATLEVS
jgi:site-specific DNA-methyltransferase (adenine-specific)